VMTAVAPSAVRRRQLFQYDELSLRSTVFAPCFAGKRGRRDMFFWLARAQPSLSDSAS